MCLKLVFSNIILYTASSQHPDQSRHKLGWNVLGAITAAVDTFVDVFLAAESHCNQHTDCTSCTARTEYNCTWFAANKTCTNSSTSVQSSCKVQRNSFRTNYSEQTSLLMLSHAYYAYGCNVKLPNTTTNITWRRDKLIGKFNNVDQEYAVSGYTALDESNQRIIVSFTGSQSRLMAAWEAYDSKLQLFDVINSTEIQQHNISSKMMIINSMYKVYKQLYPMIFQDFQQLLQTCANCSVWFTGHSLGGNLAAMAAMHFSIKLSLDVDKVLIYTFGECRAFNYDFADSIDAMFHGRLYRVVDAMDPIPHFLSCHASRSECVQNSEHRYHHGIEIYYHSNEFCEYTECLDEPFGEDPHCSNNRIYYDWRFWHPDNAHQHYRKVLLNGGFCVDRNSTVALLENVDSCEFGAVTQHEYDSNNLANLLTSMLPMKGFKKKRHNKALKYLN